MLILPAGVSATWVGAAYLSLYRDFDFLTIFLSLAFYGYLAVLISGSVIFIFVEKWVIKDRAFDSFAWVIIRIGIYFLAGLVLGWAMQMSIRFGVGTFPLIIESSYYVIALGNCFLGAVLLSFMEQISETWRKREAGLLSQNALLTDEVQDQKRYSGVLVQNSPVAIVSVNRDGNVSSWNPAAEQLFGYTEAETIGHNLDELLAKAPEMLEEARRISQETMRGSLVRSITVRGRKDKTLVNVEILSVPVRLDEQDSGHIVIYHDITALKQTEDELREAKIAAEQAKEAAEAATHAKSVFLATMSHEIRTPMNGIIGMSGLLQDTELTSEQREFTDAIRASGDTLLAIINDILDFSKIEAGRIELENEPFDLPGCVDSALEIIASQAAEKGLELGCLVEGDVPSAVIGDETRLRQILINLLGNALKFTEKGEIAVTVSAKRLSVIADASDERYEIRFAVRDTGIGVPPDRVDRLFKSFSQVDSSTSRKYGGTGLGLAISKRLCELMGGAIGFESEGIKGKGSTFFFTIQAQSTVLPPQPHLQETQPDLKGKRVLIVDDNETSVRILSLRAKAWGMIPVSFLNPLEALERAQAGEHFDLGIIDMHMPEMDGLTLINKIRQAPEFDKLPMVMLSSLGERESGVDKLQLSAFLLKPVRSSQLYSVLVKIFATQVQSTVDAGSALPSQFDRQMAQKHPLRILVAEDNPVNQNLIRLMLGRLGYQCQIAPNGKEVIQALRQQVYDVILMDVQMPEMDGLEATRIICKEWPWEQRPKIIAMTANALKEDRIACLAAGMDDYLSKPLHVAELVKSLNLCMPKDIAAPIKIGEKALAGGCQTQTGVNALGHPGAGSNALLDPAALDKLREVAGGDTSLLSQLVQVFLEDAPKLLADMHQAVKTGNAELLRRSAHSLKSNSAEFGARDLSALAKRMEEMGKAGALDAASASLEEIDGIFLQVESALQDLQRDLAGPN